MKKQFTIFKCLSVIFAVAGIILCLQHQRSLMLIFGAMAVLFSFLGDGSKNKNAE